MGLAEGALLVKVRTLGDLRLLSVATLLLSDNWHPHNVNDAMAIMAGFEVREKGVRTGCKATFLFPGGQWTRVMMLFSKND